MENPNVKQSASLLTPNLPALNRVSCMAHVFLLNGAWILCLIICNMCQTMFTQRATFAFWWCLHWACSSCLLFHDDCCSEKSWLLNSYQYSTRLQSTTICCTGTQSHGISHSQPQGCTTRKCRMQAQDHNKGLCLQGRL